MSCWVPTTGIRTRLPLARLRPAVGEQSGQAPLRLRRSHACPSCPEFQTHNPSKVRDGLQVIDLRLGFHFVAKVTMTR